MRPGDLVTAVPEAWNLSLRRSPYYEDGAEDVTDVMEPGEVGTVVEVCQPPEGIDLGPFVQARVLSPRGTIGYVPASRLEVVR